VATPPDTSTQLDPDPIIDRSLKHSIKDGVYYSAMIGTAENYFSAFAVFLKASTAQVGVLASLPPLLASFAQVISAWLGRRLGKRKEIIVGGALLQASSLIPLMVLPVWYPDLAMPLVILFAVIYFIGPNLGSPQWGSLMGELVRENRRGRFFALRTRLSSLANFAALGAAGLILHLFAGRELTYYGFVTIFSLACALRLASAWHLSQLYDPPGHVAAIDTGYKGLFAIYRESGLLPFTAFFACMQLSVAIASPYFALYMLRDLEYSYLAFMFNTAASVCIQFLTLNRWGRLSDLFGNRLILATTGFIIPIMPALWVVSTNYYYLLGVQALSGLAWAGFTLSAGNTVYDLTPKDHRVTLMAVHSVLAATGTFVGALIGAWLGTHLPVNLVLGGELYAWLTPLYGVFLISALARAITVGSFIRKLQEVRRVRPMSRAGLIFRVTRVAPLSGLIFEVVGRGDRNDDAADDDSPPDEPGRR
jgi:MFS family permease